MTRPSASLSPERFLAVAAGAHALVDGIDEHAYPIATWEELSAAAASLGEVTLRGPSGRVSVNEIGPTLEYLRAVVGDSYFPVQGADDLAHKAGMVLVSIVVRRHRSKGKQRPLSPDFDRAAAEAAVAQQREVKG